LQRDTSETDIRLDLWDAAIRMTEDHLITGVGIGEYRNRLPDYGRGKAEGKNAGAHNMYLQILAETGIIGFGLFMALLINATLILWKASKHPDPEIAALAWTWLVALIVIMVGGLTKHDFQGKLLWTCLGASVAFQFSNWLPPLTQEVNYVAHFNHRRNIS
jgi:O-antigen ligase